MLKLTKNDQKVLYELEKDCRQSLQSIARKVGLSKQLVYYIMKKYEQEKVILAYTALVDPTKIGYITYRAYLKLKNMNQLNEKENFFTFLKNMPETTIVNSIEGRYDVGLVFTVKEIHDFYEVWEKIMKYRQNIADYNVVIYSPISYFTRMWLSPHEPRKVMVAGSKEIIAHDEQDINIIKEIAKDSRKPVLEIARVLKKSPSFIKQRLKWLEKSEIILGYRPLFDWSKLGYEYYKVDLHLNNHIKNKDIFLFCRNNLSVIQVNKTIGGADFEFEVFVKNKEDFRRIIQNILNKFPDVIENYDYFTVIKPYKETFMSL